MFRENEFRAIPGLPALFFLLVLIALSIAGAVKAGVSQNPLLGVTAAIVSCSRGDFT